ncbi:MAG: NADH-quinone oxidoreductase subunit B, partial [Anaerolineaceae bacterium]|nr:NADH-quinone oxidoreductase subunit B [Anaerolineaceae bacterium]
ISGPVTYNSLEALQTVYAQVLEPKVVVAIGSCPASGNVFAGSPLIAGPLERYVPVDVYVPGCPPRPDAIISGIARAIDLLAAQPVRRLKEGAE